jgi:hypothetical protein
MNRRGFLEAMFKAGVAAYVVTHAGVLMPGRGTIITPTRWIRCSFVSSTGEVFFAESDFGEIWEPCVGNYFETPTAAASKLVGDIDLRAHFDGQIDTPLVTLDKLAGGRLEIGYGKTGPWLRRS